MKKQILVLGVLLVLLASFAVAESGNGEGKNKSGNAYGEGRKLGSANETPGLGVREHARDKAQEKLVNSAERVLDFIQRLQDRIEQSPVLTQEQKDSLASKVEGQKAYFEDIQDEIDNTTDITGLRGIAKEMRDEFKDLRANLRVIVGNIWTAHLDNVITRLENASAKLEDKVSQLSDSGVDTSGLEDSLGEIDSELEEANGFKEEAEEVLGGITDWESAQSLFREAKELVKESLESIKGARQAIRGALKGIREASGDTEDNLQVLSTDDGPLTNTTGPSGDDSDEDKAEDDLNETEDSDSSEDADDSEEETEDSDGSEDSDSSKDEAEEEDD